MVHSQVPPWTLSFPKIMPPGHSDCLMPLVQMSTPSSIWGQHCGICRGLRHNGILDHSPFCPVLLSSLPSTCLVCLPRRRP